LAEPYATMVNACVLAGLRVSELVRLKWEMGRCTQWFPNSGWTLLQWWLGMPEDNGQRCDNRRRCHCRSAQTKNGGYKRARDGQV